jgi:hypothetical protein
MAIDRRKFNPNEIKRNVCFLNEKKFFDTYLHNIGTVNFIFALFIIARNISSEIKSFFVCFDKSVCPFRTRWEREAKLKIPSTINTWNKMLSTVIWADRNWLVSGRLASTSSKNLKSYTIQHSRFDSWNFNSI